MIKRCIMIFPQFENGQVIDRIREKYDPLANHVRPHITLVFPFESDIKTEELKEHISSVILEQKPFEVVLNKITPNESFGRYLFLNIHTGNDRIIELHRKFYTGILKPFFPDWLNKEAFLPHMTVGSFDGEEDFMAAINDTKNINNYFNTIVNEISVEIIDENEDSIIEFNITLK